MEWILSKPLESDTNIRDYERKYGIELPSRLIDLIRAHNGGRPRPNVFDTKITKERIAKSLLSFNPSSVDNIWDTTENMRQRLPRDYYPFMIDQFGNYICLYYDPLVEVPAIMFWDEELQLEEGIAVSIEEMMKKFH
ncbi:SMI1/KNR4 family protein [Exiguobacterium sp. s193]|uniref:SMI1/KNR4 family protein n=1 Tax=Exiguobacterium sp. s193 TaxID=2751207 RepID=UPI001BEA018D|nr:SMI1/KNR4 family protein [Exiguobacterium sp. s193]